jgi:hypothetical protein
MIRLLSYCGWQQFLPGIISASLYFSGSEFAHAQQVTIGAPMTNVGTNFRENIGVGWGFNIPTGNPAAGARGVVGLGPNGPQQGINFGFGGPGNAPTPFGLGNPNPAQLGWQVQGANGGRLGFNIFADQGASTTLTSQTPMLTVMNGQQGFFASTVQRPFVTGLIPVVNDYGAGFAPTVVYPSMSIPWPNPNDGNRGTSVVNERWSRIQANETARSTRVEPPAPAQPVAAAMPAARGNGRSSAERGAPSLAEIRRAQEAEDAVKAQNPPPATKRLRLEE